MKNKIRQLALLDFKTCYKPTVIKIVWNWYKDRQLGATDNPERDLCTCGNDM